MGASQIAERRDRPALRVAMIERVVRTWCVPKTSLVNTCRCAPLLVRERAVEIPCAHRCEPQSFKNYRRWRPMMKRSCLQPHKPQRGWIPEPGSRSAPWGLRERKSEPQRGSIIRQSLNQVGVRGLCVTITQRAFQAWCIVSAPIFVDDLSGAARTSNVDYSATSPSCWRRRRMMRERVWRMAAGVVSNSAATVAVSILSKAAR